MNLQDIKLILFSSKTDRHFKRITRVITKRYPQYQIYKCTDLEKLSMAVKGTFSGFGILLIVARDRDELSSLVGMSHSLKEHLLILILDSSVDDLFNMALKLYPRYTSCFKDDYSDVYMVLDKMIKNTQSKIEGRGKWQGISR